MSSNKTESRKKASRNDGKTEVKSSDLSLRGRSFVGTVISARMQKTVTVEWGRRHLIKKYERYEKRRSRVKVHNPENINAKEGDVVRIMECRPISKTKNFVIVEVLGKEKGFRERMEAEEESKVKKVVKEEGAQETNPEKKGEVEA